MIVAYRNPRRRTIFWPVAGCGLLAIPPGASLQIASGELDPLMAEVLRIAVAERLLVIDDGADDPVLH